MVTDQPAKRKSDGREVLLDVARTLFLASGFDAVSMQQVAEAAGMTKGAPYYHFRNKDDLFLSVFVREIERLRDSLIAALEGPGPLRDRLKVGVLSVTEGTRGDFDQLIRDFESHFDGEPTCLPHNGEGLDISELLIPYFASARESGEFSRLTAERAVEFFMIVLLGQMKATEYKKLRNSPEYTIAQRSGDLVDLLFDGI